MTTVVDTPADGDLQNQHLIDRRLWQQITTWITWDHEFLDNFGGRPHAVQREWAERALNEAVGFLRLCADYDDCSFSPSTLVGIAWRAFIVHTHGYVEFCELIAGRYLHYTPAGENSLAPATKSAAETLTALRARGSVDEELWRSEVATTSHLPASVRREFVERYANGQSTRAIADHYHISYSRVHHVLKQAGVTFRTPGPPRVITETNRRDILKRYEAHEPVAEIAASYGISPKSVWNFLHKSGVAKGSNPRISDDIRPKIVEFYKGGLSVSEIVSRLNVSDTSVRRTLQQAGVSLRPREGTGVYTMSIYKRNFDLIRQGRVTTEIRVNDSRRKWIRAGAQIRFRCLGDEVLARVTRVSRYTSFEDMLDHESGASIAPQGTREEQLVALRAMYQPEREALGVLAIGIELVDPPRPVRPAVVRLGSRPAWTRTGRSASRKSSS